MNSDKMIAYCKSEDDYNTLLSIFKSQESRCEIKTHYNYNTHYFDKDFFLCLLQAI